METKLDRTMENFMTVTAKSTVAVIVPLYGYWSDIQDNPLIKEQVLSVVMKRIYSNVHHLYIIFVANPESIPNEANNPGGVANIILTMSQSGNVKTIPVARDANYSEYIEAGMESALHETNARFVVVFNPWVMIQENAIDVLVDRANRADMAKLISGFDLRSVVEPEAFDDFKITVPKEEWDFTLDFTGMPRFAAEMIQIDTKYKTHAFLEKDISQYMFKNNFGVITSQRVPIYPFEFPWKTYETKEDYDHDRNYFSKKWGFDCGVKRD